ncbi:MAG: outer membrane beta-barrel protein [Chitinophagales bacterium]
MKKTYFLLLIFLPLLALSQKDSNKKNQHNPLGIGLKIGLNFSNVTNASAINASHQTGFNAGIIISPPHQVIGSRTEIYFSRQGFGYGSDSASGKATNDYIMLAQMMSIRITKWFELMFGAQTGYMISAKVDTGLKTGIATIDNALSYYNRFDYGFGGGIEVHPFSGLIVGARYCISLSELYKTPDYSQIANGGTMTSFSPDLNLKSNVVQLYLGWEF